MLTLDTNRAVVLLRATNLIRKILGGRGMIKLGSGKIFRGPARAAVNRDVRAPVVAIDHSLRIVRINPEIVIVAVLRAKSPVSLAAIG